MLYWAHLCSAWTTRYCAVGAVLNLERHSQLTYDNPGIIKCCKTTPTEQLVCFVNIFHVQQKKQAEKNPGSYSPEHL